MDYSRSLNIFYAYRRMSSEGTRIQFIQFQKNLALVGGVLYMTARSDGRFGISKDTG